ncbi:hypothetical protein MMC16_002510 [Acarospora aff. strigata]|nr:hypothetical protein [Acarospora aff. strigata]
MSPASTKSGIITSESGERHIPASTRPDGTKRKEIKIRPGYKPLEDVEVYKNRTAEAWKTRGAGGVPGAAAADEDRLDGDGDGKANNKNAKRREARKKAKGADEAKELPRTGAKIDESGATENAEDALLKENWRAASNVEELDPEAEKEKQARNLKKKLRQARELREKREKGDNLLPEQFEKVIKINELIRQLDTLGFDSEGEPKLTA